MINSSLSATAIRAARDGDPIRVHHYNIQLVLAATRNKKPTEPEAIRAMHTCQNLQQQMLALKARAGRVEARAAALAPPPPLPRRSIKSARGQAILDILAVSEQPLCLNELAEQLQYHGDDIDLAILRRVITQMVSVGRLERVPNDRTDLSPRVRYLYKLAERGAGETRPAASTPQPNTNLKPHRARAILDILAGFDQPLCVTELRDVLELRGDEIDLSTLRKLITEMLHHDLLVRVPNDRTDLPPQVLYLYVPAETEVMA